MHLNIHGKYVLLYVENYIITLFMLLQGWSFGEPQEKSDEAELKKRNCTAYKTHYSIGRLAFKMGMNHFRVNSKMSVAKEK